MKTKRILFLPLIVCAAFAVSAQAGDRHRSNGNTKSTGSASAHYSGVTSHSSSGVRYGGNRSFSQSPRMTTRSRPQFSQRHIVSGGSAPIVQRQFTPRTFTERSGNDVAKFQSNRRIRSEGALQQNRLIEGNRFRQMQGQRRDGFAQSQGQHLNRTAQFGTGGRNRTIGNISPGHNHVFAQHSANWNRNWDRRHDHWWNGHRCRWVNNSWFIFDIGFIPWFGWPYYDYYAYDYYPYAYPYGYGYGYDSGAYYGSNYYNQNGYDSSYEDQGDYDSSYYNRNSYGSSDESTEIAVADAQQRLARAGYYRGQIDGVLGPETRHALVRYQSDKGLEPSGNLTPDTLRSLGVQQVARYGAASY